MAPQAVDFATKFPKKVFFSKFNAFNTENTFEQNFNDNKVSALKVILCRLIKAKSKHYDPSYLIVITTVFFLVDPVRRSCPLRNAFF
jgi:hypothetical protein